MTTHARLRTGSARTIPVADRRSRTTARSHLRIATERSFPSVRLLLIGWGPHADRTYLPHVAALRADGHSVAVAAAVEIEASREAVMSRAACRPDAPELVFVEPCVGEAMDAGLALRLDRLVDRLGVNAVIVATPPEAHYVYVAWALRRGLSVLVDKPVTTRPDAVNDLRAARGIKDDVVELVAAYRAAQRRSRVCVLVNAQRRWHPAFDHVRKRIEEVRDRTGQPVSFISAAHADGQWRMPSEWVDMGYHGYNRGNGKLSHSGFHEIDMLLRLLQAGWTPATKPDRARIMSSLIQPGALLNHLPRQRYESAFGSEKYGAHARYSDEELRRIAGRLGEVDASVLIELERGDVVDANARIDLHHNSVSARSWLAPRDNLYKGMGRMKQERWVIHCGPYQSIRIETLQAEDEHDGSGEKGHALGGPNHLEIAIVRNDALLGGPRLEVVQGHELATFDGTRLHSEQVKMAALREFVDFVQGTRTHADLRSDLTDHLLPAAVMSACYESHVRRRARRDGWVAVSL